MFGLQNTLKLFLYIRKLILGFSVLNLSLVFKQYSYNNDSDTNDVSVIKCHAIFKVLSPLQMKLSHWHCVMFNPRLMYEISLFKYRKRF